MDWKKLFKDKENGDFDNRMVIVFENDSGYWRCDIDNEDRNEQMCQEYTDKYGEPNGYGYLVDIMIGAGFKSEWC